MAPDVKSVAKRIVSAVAAGVASAGLLPRRVIVRVDGGICSQMHFWLVGQVFARKGCHVTFDTRWFAECGMDNDGRFSRNFDLLKAFPRLPFRSESEGLIRRLYISAFYSFNNYYDVGSGTSWQKMSPPLYLDGYYRDSDDMFGAMFDESFPVDTGLLPEDNVAVLNDIEAASLSGDSCAVHIRRGDLARYEAAYGSPVSEEYFRQSVSVVLEESPEAHFFLFSDEPDWCREHIVPGLGEAKLTVVDVNGSDRGWCDLILMSRCRHQVTSQGSMGKYAALLRPARLRDGLVTLPPNANSREWPARFDNARIIANNQD